VAVNYTPDGGDEIMLPTWIFWGPYKTAEEMFQASKGEVLSNTNGFINETRLFKAVEFNEA